MSQLKSEVEGSVRTVYFTAARILDELSIRGIGEELIGMVEKCEEEKILLDFSTVQFLSSAALGMLIRFYKRCKEFKVRLKLCSIAPDILDVFKITGLNKVFDIHKDRAQALTAFER